MQWSVPPLWEGGECWIIGGGPSVPREFGVPEEITQQIFRGEKDPSAYSPYLAPIHDKHVIGVNNAYQIGNWIDVLFFGDCRWYTVHQQGLWNFTGLKLTCCGRFHKKPKELSEGIRYLGQDTHGFGISENPEMVSWNGNSGAAAISVARHLGVRRIVLLGFDMTVDNHRTTHWHGRHRDREKTFVPPFERHKMGFSYIADDAKRLGIEILNASPNSTIKELKKVSVKDLL